MPRIVTGPNGEGAVFQGDPGSYTFDVQPPAGYRDAPNQEVSLTDGGDVVLTFRLVKSITRAVVAVLEDGTGNPLPNVAIDATATGA